MGKKVALIEQMGYLGGTGTVNGVNVFSPGYHDGERYIMDGIFAEVYRELLNRNALIPHWHAWEPFNMETYKLILETMLKDAGVDVWLDTSLVYANVSDNRISNILVNTLKGCVAIEAKQFIDATADGFLGADMGMEVYRHETLQPATTAARVMISLNQTGEAAGVAAYEALTTNRTVQNIDFKSMREKMKQGGSIVF